MALALLALRFNLGPQYAPRAAGRRFSSAASRSTASIAASTDFVDGNSPLDRASSSARTRLLHPVEHGRLGLVRTPVRVPQHQRADRDHRQRQPLAHREAERQVARKLSGSRAYSATKRQMP
jgi:hypothetical protein